MTVLLVCIIQLIVDILYAFVDPRLRSQYEGARKKKKNKPSTKTEVAK